MNLIASSAAGRPLGCFGDADSLLSPGQAVARILSDVTKVDGDEPIPAREGIGRVCAVDIVSDVALPRFDNSAVDGFGLHRDDLAYPGRFALELDGTTFAGQDASRPLLPGKCRRILTGARVPADVATIVMEEHVRREGAIIEMDRCPDHGANIRRAGEDVAAGAVVIRRGTILDGRHVAMLASIGAHHISSVRRLRVAVMSTGDELVEPGREVGAGMIPDANRPMILSLIAGPAIDATDLGMAADDGGDLAGRLADAGRRFDLLVTTGGVSGSEADLVSPALVAAGGRSEPMRLALRPGKPILSGRVGGCKIVALPGNPVAALVGYILFVRAVLIEMSGARSGAGSSPARAADPFPHKLGRTEFIPAAVVGRDCDGLPLLRKLGRGGSARLLPLVEADGFAEIPATAGDVAAGEFVSFHPFSTALNL